nr:MAG: polyprotein 1 [Picornavirales sp.]
MCSMNNKLNLNQKNQNKNKNYSKPEKAYQVCAKVAPHATYLLFNHGARSMRSISRQQFSEIGKDTPCVVYKEYKMRYKGCDKKFALEMLFSFLDNNYRAEGLWEDVTETRDGISAILKFIKIVGRANKAFSSVYTTIITKLTMIFLSISNMLQNFSIVNITSFALTLYDSVSSLFESFKAESLESIALASLSMCLPTSLFEIVKRMQLLGGMKIGQDTSVFNKFLEYVSSFIHELLNVFKCVLPESLHPFLATLSTWTVKRHLLEETRELIESSKKNSRCFMNPFFRERVKKILKIWKATPELVEWSRHSQFVKNIESDLIALSKSVHAQENLTRKEPCMFVFEGPPGCYKSVTMGLVIKALNEPAYAHNIKSTMDGKDFYDTYENEPIFYMDDVGQQGVSQWRTFINWVSNMNFKLDCADAKLKDTKYFTSDKIMLTTNEFMNLSGICRNDGIADVTALWRRGYVFDFSQAKRAGSRLQGQIAFRYYHMETNSWVAGFPRDLELWMYDRGIDLPSTKDLTGPRINYIGWITQIIKCANGLKAEQSTHHDLTEEEKEILNSKFYIDGPRYFDAEDEIIPTGESKTKFYLEALRDWSCEIVASFLEKIVSYVDDNKQFLTAFTGIIFGCVCIVLASWFGEYIGNKYAKPDYQSEVFEVLDQKLKERSASNSLVDSVSKNMFFAEISSDNKTIQTCVTASGHYLILPYHSLPFEGDFYVSLYKEPKSKYYVIDKLKGAVVYANENDDVGVIELPRNIPSFFRSLSKLFKEDLLDSYNAWFCTPKGSFDIENSLLPRTGTFTYVYPNTGELGTISEKDLEYNFHAQGMCGCVVVDSRTGIKGMHVAGSDLSGVSLLWSRETISQIKKIITDDSFLADVDFKEVMVTEDISGMKLDVKMNVYTNNKSSIIPSPMYGVLETTRSPANLSKYGPHTVKDVAKKSFAVQKGVSSMELDFARKYLESIIEPFDVITEKEVVLGNDYLAKMNKKSSNGYACVPGKENYMNFETGEYTQLGRESVNAFKARMDNDEYVLDDWVWTECLKDEIRNDTKCGEPRSFRISKVQIQMVTKELTGQLVANLMKSRKDHKIMIGMNPFLEFDEIYKILSECKAFDGDVGYWDGKMLSQTQQMVEEVLTGKFRGSERNKNYLKKILCNMINTVIALNDDAWVTTHSMPSGCFLTAMVNSLINQSNSAMWYFREMTAAGRKPTIYDFRKNLILYVYGDDLMTGVRKNEDILNAITLRNFYESIGMTFTDSKKQRIETPFNDLKDMTFLKRSFVFHPKIGRVMCPLSLQTLYSGLSYVDKKKEARQVMCDKVHNFQREMYLHVNMNFEQVVYNVLRVAQSLGINVETLSESYLLFLYTDKEEMESLPWSTWVGDKYV